MSSAVAAMTQEEYLLLNELIVQRFGISFPENRRSMLESRLRPRLEELGLQRYREYYLHLQCDLNGESRHLAEAVTNNETYFFREPQQLDSLFTYALDLARHHGSLRILSAGCSSGEEPYSLAIFAHLHAPRLLGTRVEIDAIDVDPGRIAIAREAHYGRSSLRTLTAEDVDLYFEAAACPGCWSLRPLYRRGVRFAPGNLLEPATLPVPAGGFDVVFCRNVLIYFAESALHRAVDAFASVLRPGGLLFLGAAESIIGLSSNFETLRVGRGIAYRYSAP